MRRTTADNVSIRAKRDDKLRGKRAWKRKTRETCRVGILDILEWMAATMGHDGRSTAELRAWERSNGI